MVSTLTKHMNICFTHRSVRRRILVPQRGAPSHTLSAAGLPDGGASEPERPSLKKDDTNLVRLRVTAYLAGLTAEKISAAVLCAKTPTTDAHAPQMHTYVRIACRGSRDQSALASAGRDGKME
jgi:hypothetical protein